MIRRIVMDTITCAGGGAGTSTGSGTTKEPINGILKAVHLNYGASMAATSDVTVSTKSAPTKTLLSKADNATDGWFYPQAQIHQASDGAAVAAQYEEIAVADYVTVAVAQANVGDTLIATLEYWE